jgi:hypothetical protein
MSCSKRRCFNEVNTSVTLLQDNGKPSSTAQQFRNRFGRGGRYSIVPEGSPLPRKTILVNNKVHS